MSSSSRSRPHGQVAVLCVALLTVLVAAATATAGTAVISGRVFNDVDGNGVFDGADGALASVATVTLYQVNGESVVQVGAAQTTTLNYSFTDLDAGLYFVAFTPPAGLSLSPKDRGNNDALDSDADPTTGRTGLIEVKGGATAASIDAGMAVLYGVGDFVFRDADADGIQDDGEAGVANVLLSIYAAGTNSEVDSGDVRFAGAVTDSNGHYAFSVPAGAYWIEVFPPTGSSLSPVNATGDDARDSDADAQTKRTAVFSVSAADDTRDFGLINDRDGDLTPDADDECPDDAAKTAPGTCGCGVSDVDTDQDGFADCVDNCPQEYDPFQADTDGDGVGDVCETSADNANANTNATPQINLPRDDPRLANDNANANDNSSGEVNDIADLLELCGMCGPMGLVTYGLGVASYGGLLAWRRRRR